MSETLNVLNLIVQKNVIALAHGLFTAAGESEDEKYLKLLVTLKWRGVFGIHFFNS